MVAPRNPYFLALAVSGAVAESVEMHKDAIKKGQRIAVIDDLLATGGTAEATVRLVEKMGGKVVGVAFVVELDFLNGRNKLKKYDLISLVHYEKE